MVKAKESFSNTHSPSPRLLTDDEIVDEVRLNWRETMDDPTQKMIDAVIYWQIGQDENGNLGCVGIRNGENHEAQLELEKYVASYTHDGTIYRGISADKPLDLEVGKIIDQKGLSSWTINRQVAEEFSEAGNISYVFVMEGRSIRSRLATGNGVLSGLGEVIVSGLNRQQITAIEKEEPGYFVVHVKDVSESKW